MLRWLFVLLLIPFLDAVVLAIFVSQTPMIGWVGMVLLVVLTGLIGMLLVRAEGRRTIRKIQRALEQGKPPTNELLDGALLIAAGAFLLTPGLVTDFIGFLLVIPPTRIPIRAALKRFIVVPYIDKRTDGLASGAVWTFGFPDEGVGAGTGAGAGSGTNGTQTQSARESTTDRTDEFAEDAYTVNFRDVTRDDDDEVDAR